MGEAVIELDAVTKAYKIYRNPRHRAFEMLIPGVPELHAKFWALRAITLRIERGETIGIVGVNGSGKSTLLQIIAGIMRATSGTVAVRGRVSSLLELGAGFHPELSGRENVELFGTVMGLTLADIRSRMPAIEAFAGIGEFIDRPVRVYSSGMFVRLAFAAAINVDPDVLLVDEALAVGDAAFQHKCMNRIRDLQTQGTTILVVSHDMGMIKAICSWVVLLDAGEIIAQGNPAEIASLYFAKASVAIAAAEAPHQPPPSIIEEPRTIEFRPDPGFEARSMVFRHGTGAAKIRNIELLDADRRPVPLVAFDQEVTLRVHVEYYQDAPTSVVGFGIRDRTGTEIIGTNTYEEQVTLPACKAGETLIVDFRLRLPLVAGDYSVSSAVAADRHTRAYFDWIDNALILAVAPPESGKAVHGKVWLPVQIDVHAS
jgi:lipopolysaccharide transport system ATP-binding protein